MKQGRSIIPLHPGEKHPVIIRQFTKNGVLVNIPQQWELWQHKQITWATLRKRLYQGMNFGEVPGYAEYTVLDIDRGKLSSEGQEACDHWLNSHKGLLENCPISKTPNGGYHIWTVLDVEGLNGKIWVKHPISDLPYAIGEFRYSNYIAVFPSVLINKETGEVKEYQIIHSSFDYEPQAIRLDDLHISLNAFKSDDAPKDIDFAELSQEHPTQYSDNLFESNVYNPDKYMQTVIENNLGDIKGAASGDRNNTFFEKLSKAIQTARQLNKDFNFVDKFREQALLIGLTDSEIDNSIHSSFNQKCSFKLRVVEEPLTSYVCLMLRFTYVDHLIKVLSIINTGKKLRRDSKIASVLFGIYSYPVPQDTYNDVGHYTKNGLWVRSISTKQLAKHLGLTPRAVNDAIKILERWGILLRFNPPRNFQSSILIIGDEAQGYYLEQPVAPEYRSKFKQVTDTEQQALDEEVLFDDIRELLGQDEPKKFKRPVELFL